MTKKLSMRLWPDVAFSRWQLDGLSCLSFGAARLMFIGWLLFLLALLLVGFYPLLSSQGLAGLQRLAGLGRLEGLRVAGVITALFYSYRIAIGAFLLSLLLAFFMAGSLPMGIDGDEQRAIRRLRSWLVVCFLWLAVPTLSLLAGFDSFYQSWLANYPDPRGYHHLLALVIKETPFLLLTILLARQRLARQYRLLATGLGYGPWMTFVKIEWPLLWPDIVWPLIISLLFAFNNIETGLLLGPSAPPSLPLLFFNALQHVDLNQQGTIAILSVWLLLANVVLVVAFFMAVALLKKLTFLLLGGGRWWHDGIMMALGRVVFYAVILHGFFLLLLMVWLGAGRLWSLGGDAGSVGELWAAAGYSFLLAIMSSFAAVSLFLWWRFQGLLGPSTMVRRQVAKRRWMTWLGIGSFYRLPYHDHDGTGRVRGHGRNAVAMLFILPLCCPDIWLANNIHLLANLFSLPMLVWLFLCHLVFAFGFSYLLLMGFYDTIPPSYLSHGQTLGLSPLRLFWRVVVPWLWRPLWLAVALTAAVSLGLYGPNVILALFPTLTTLLVGYQLSADRALAAAAGTLLLLLPLLFYGAAYVIGTWPFRGLGGMGGAVRSFRWWKGSYAGFFAKEYRPGRGAR